MNKTVTKSDITKPFIHSAMRVAAYARVSSGKDEMLHSLAAQVCYYSNYIQKQPNWKYVGVYADAAYTGTKDNRPEFKQLMKDCRDGKIDLVLTKSISRFARNTLDLLKAVRELKHLNVGVFFEEQNIHTLSGDGELLLTILASYAQEESRSASENCKWRIRKQFEKGELANLRFLYGYKILKGKVEIEPNEAYIVRMIFQDYADGIGAGNIAKKLKDMRVRTPRGGAWNSVRVLAIVKNEKYTGNALLQKRFVVDHLTKKLINNKGQLPMYLAMDTHPAIIPKDLFDKAQAMLQKQRSANKTIGDTRNRYPVSGLIRCGICGSKYKRKIRKNMVVWQCTRYLNEGKSACPARQIPEATVYACIFDVLGLTEGNAEVIRNQIEHLLVLPPDRLVFVQKDGQRIDTNWESKSRKESWTHEMREAARTHAAGRWNRWRQASE